MNKYVSFISDKDFKESAEKVVNAYILDENKVVENIHENVEEDAYNLLTKSKNTTDEIKALFDVTIKHETFTNWMMEEKIRQADKKINNKIGEFHQEILGKVDGWVDLGIGDKTEIDIKKEDNSIFMEVKNKHNSMNSSSTKTCRDKLENVIKLYPEATAYWGFIITKNYKDVDEIWHMKKYEDNPQIRKIGGNKVYELVTGNPNALKEVYYAIPKVIPEILGKDYKITDAKTKNIIKKYGDYLFKQKQA